MASSPTAKLDQDGIHVYRPRKYFIAWDKIEYIDFKPNVQSDLPILLPIILKERELFPDSIEGPYLNQEAEVGIIFLNLQFAPSDTDEKLRQFLKLKNIPTSKTIKPQH